DWCISRQLWWGHRIPAYFITVKGEKEVDDSCDDYWVSALSEQEAIIKACKKLNLPAERIHLRQDEDVLDTWFSSALFPFSVFGWPSQTQDLKNFYPGNLLETGYDILFFWVARMVFFGQKLTGQLPFKEVYLHSVVRDAHGRKMSKSLGNVIDPLDVIRGTSLLELFNKLGFGNLDANEIARAEKGLRHDYPDGIPECGTDALRFALCAYTGQGRDVNLDVLRVEGYRHFCNKIWNAFKFTLMTLGNTFIPVDRFHLFGVERVVDLWILSRLSACVKAADEGFSQYDFSKVTTACFSFWLYEFCDVYLESVKPVMQCGDDLLIDCCRQILYFVMDTALRLISPFMPFITEELWQRLPSLAHVQRSESICVAKYPTPKEYCWENVDAERQISLAMSIVRSTRAVRADYNLTPKVRTKLFITPVDDAVADDIRQCEDLIATLSLSSNVEQLSSTIFPAGCATYPIGSKCNIHVLLQGLIDINLEVSKLTSRREKLINQLDAFKKVMTTVDYEEKVPKQVKESNITKEAELKSELTHIEESISALVGMLENTERHL
ncbi:unnamed protein product, partial [Soboliphyme baturini]|uniref:valine--tRNA ligase n=1 Tax=Soboliphyme baturini TaxID=241478 RepID=A0A183IUR1_9BILA